MCVCARAVLYMSVIDVIVVVLSFCFSCVAWLVVGRCPSSVVAVCLWLSLCICVSMSLSLLPVSLYVKFC